MWGVGRCGVRAADRQCGEKESLDLAASLSGPKLEGAVGPSNWGHSLALPATPPFLCETKLFEKLLGRPKWIAAATKLTY